jgi:hypothetical protein
MVRMGQFLHWAFREGEASRQGFMQRCGQWMRRYVEGAPGGLGFAAELWADVSAHPAAARLQALAQARGRSLDAAEMKYHITDPLLFDVIHAACGIEYTVEELLAAIDVVQQWSDEHPLQGPEPPDEYGVASDWDASFEVSNLLVWARTLIERLESEIRQRGVKVRIGLLPALADGDLKDEVQRFHDELAGWVEAEGYLAGYALHIGRLHGGTPSFRRGPNGRVRFLLPDRPGDKIWSWEEFTYRHNRDAAAVAVDLLERVERFMDNLLTSFEQHVPRRFRP